MVSKTSSTSNKVQRRLSMGYSKIANRRLEICCVRIYPFSIILVMGYLDQLLIISEYNVVHE